MKVIALLTKAAFTVVLAGVVLPSCRLAAAELECRDVPTSHLQVYVARHSALTVIPATQPDMAGASDDEGVVADWRAHPLLLIAPRYASQIMIDERTVAGDNATACATPSDVRVRLGLSDYLVYIDKAAHADDCVRDVLIRHATAHLAADNAAMTAFVARNRDVIATEVSRLKRMAYPDEQAAVAGFKAGMGETLAGVLDAFRRERPRAYADANRSLEQSEFETACDGRLKALESDARFEGRRADASSP
jgi:hypothetical protein